MAEPDDFYVGYLERAPAGVARFVRRAVALLALLVVAVAIVLVLAQQPFSAARFEFGSVRAFEGTLRAAPHPQLEVSRPGRAAAGVAARSRYLLVSPGKHGAAAAVAAFDGRHVALSGTLIYRDGETMIEVEDGSIRALAGAPLAPAVSRSLGSFTLEGEIVDSKCYLGVMKPGSGKSHRECAVRCLSGGVPPLFVVRDGAGPRAQLLLVGRGGEPIGRRVLDHVAEPVSISGEVVAVGERWQLRADASSVRSME